MTTSENQKIIIVSKALSDKDHPYSIINLEAADAALSGLKTSAFKLWFYLAKNQNQYKMALSRVAFCRAAGVTKNTYISAVNELIDKGYLVPIKNNSNTYTFYELPNKMTDPDTKEDCNIEFPTVKIKEVKEFKF